MDYHAAQVQVVKGKIQEEQINKQIPKCKRHDKHIIMCCETCDYLLVCVDCVEHTNHTLITIPEVAGKRRISLVGYLRTAETDSGNLSSVLETISKKKLNNEEQKQNVVDNIIKQKNEMIAEIEKVASELVNEAKQIHETNLTVLENSEKKIQDAFDEINKCIDECKVILELAPSSTSDLILLEAYEGLSKRIDGIQVHGVVLCITEQIFQGIDDKHDFKTIGSMFGRIHSMGGEENISQEPTTDTDLSKTSATSASSFQLRPNVCGIVTNNGGKSWVTRLSDEKQCTDIIELVNETGEIEKTYNVTQPVSDITSLNEDSVLVCCCDGTVLELEQNSIENVWFPTETDPSGICLTSDGYVVICFYSRGKIVKYGKDGRIMQTIDSSSILYAGKGGVLSFLQRRRSVSLKILFPHKVAADKTSKTLAIVDKSEKKPRLIVTDTDFNIKFLFNGSFSYLPDKQGEPELTLRRFSPNGVCFDDNGNILLANGLGSRTIIMLNSSGQNIKTLLTEPTTETIYSINVDTEGRIWAGFKSGTIKIIKY